MSKIFTREYDIPFTKLWIEIELDNEWFNFQIRELYTPADNAKSVLGSSDSRPIVELGFRLP